MAIAKLKPTADIPEQPAPIIVEKTSFKGVVVDDSELRIDSMVAYLDGMPWTVNYYRQLIGEHNDIRDLDPGQNAAFQQYEKINTLELRVGSSLQPSYDASTGITTVTGNATLGFTVPNINDYFVSDAGKGKEGLFRVKMVERKTFNRDSVYQIDYDLVCYISDSSTLYNDLESKVVRQYFFSKEKLAEGLSPVLREEQYTASINIAKYYVSTIQRYFDLFFNRSTMTLVVPSQTGLVYDAMVTEFLLSITDSQDASEIRDMKIISIDNDRYMKQGMLWKALLSRDYDEIDRIHQKHVVVPRTYFNKHTLLKSAYFWATSYVYPLVEEDMTKVLGVNRDPYPLTERKLEGTATMEARSDNTYQLHDTVIPLIKSVNIDDYYVLSEAFYTKRTDLSGLEILVKDYLKASTIDLPMLGALVKAYPDWPVLEQYYYGPLLMLLMKDAIKGFYR